MDAVNQQEPNSSTRPPTEQDETLAQQLDRLNAELQKAKKAHSDAALGVTDLQGRIAALSTLQKDIDKATADYEVAHSDLAKREQALHVYYDYETKCLTEIVGAAKRTIEQAVEDAESELAKATEKVDAAKKTLDTQEDQRAKADAARQQANTAASELKKLAVTIKARLAALDTIKTEVNTAKRDTDYALAYWLLVMSEFSSILESEPKLMDPAELPDALLAAVNTLSDAEKEYAEKALEVSQQEAVRVDAETKLKTMEKEYDESLRNVLMAIKPTVQSDPTELAEAARHSGPSEPPEPSEQSDPSESADNPTDEDVDNA
jgi:DNA repair exonuclease SbcCD ATPase subunit